MPNELWRAYQEWLELGCPEVGLARDEYIAARDALLEYVERWHGSGRGQMLTERAEAMSELRDRVAVAGIDFAEDEHVAETLRGSWPGPGANCITTRAARTIHAAGVAIPIRLLADRPELASLTRC